MRDFWTKPYLEFVRETVSPCQVLDLTKEMDGTKLRDYGYEWDGESGELVLALDSLVYAKPEDQWKTLQHWATLGDVVIVVLLHPNCIYARGPEWHSMDADDLLDKLERNYQILNKKTYNEFARLVAYKGKPKVAKPKRKKRPVEEVENNG
jgi:hypothetical protein